MVGRKKGGRIMDERVLTETTLQACSRLQNEVLRLKQENADLLFALVGLTDMGQTEKGAVIVGPHGWKLAQDILAKYRC